jgi:hypothetical protein
MENIKITKHDVSANMMMYKDSHIIKVEKIENKVCIFAISDVSKPLVKRNLCSYTTGQTIDKIYELDYIDSVVLEPNLHLHIFEKRSFHIPPYEG